MRKTIALFFGLAISLVSVVDGQVVESGREAALKSVADEPQVTASNEDLAGEYAFQYRQTTQERLSRLFQNSIAATRQTDLFGAPMGSPLRDATVKKAKTQDEGAEEAEEMRKIQEGFGGAVRGLDIRVVNAGRREFLCGADNIFEGDVLDLSSGTGMYRVWIVSVKPDGITFMDGKSRQTETVPLSLDAPAVKTRSWGAVGKASEAPPF